MVETVFTTFNRVSMMLMEEWSTPDELCACDACPSGCGGITQSEYFHEEFPPNISQLNMHINALELLTIVVALKIWGNRLKGKKGVDVLRQYVICQVDKQGDLEGQISPIMPQRNFLYCCG